MGAGIGGSSGTASVAIALAASGQVVAGVAGKRIRVFAWAVVSRLATDVKLQSNTTDITGALPFAANGGVVWPGGMTPWCVTAKGEALNLNMTVNTAVNGVLVYDLV